MDDFEEAQRRSDPKERERDALGQGRVQGFFVGLVVTLLLIFLFQYLDAHR